MERATTIRMPSTANLMLDSDDRNPNTFPSAFDFQIQKSQSIQNGFFTRIGVTEVVLEWCEPNITSGSSIVLDVSGAATRADVTLSIGTGYYTMETLIGDIVELYNDPATTKPAGTTLNSSKQLGAWGFDLSGGQFQVISTPLALSMGLNIGGGLDPRQPINGCPDLRLYRYIDITSSQLTYAQDLKDNSTQTINRDVLVRWYMSEDVPEQRDALGFPILMGYEPFVRRRLFNPPKQIKWDPNLPVGNLSFQVYDESGSLLPPSEKSTAWLMTLQLSEN